MAKKKKTKEIFEVEKGDKEKVVEKKSEYPEEEGDKNQEKSEGKQLKTIIIVLGIILLGLILGIVYYNSTTGFDYEGLNFEIIDANEVRFYHSKFLIDHPGNKINYNLYIRNDPRTLENIPFNGSVKLKNPTLLSFEDDFQCEGKGVIAVANMRQYFDSMQVNTLRDDDTTACDERYTMLRLREGNETRINQIEDSCYNVQIKDCEIIEGTEKFMVEVIKKAKEEGLIEPL